MNIYYCNIHEFHTLEGIHLLSQERQDYIHKFRSNKEQIRCLIAGLMIRRGLGDEYYNKLTTGSHGKPIVADQLGPYFNVSHSGDYVVFAMSPATIGIDVEVIATYSYQVAKKCFHPNELQWLDHTGTNEAFYQIWCGKESIMKATGQGFTMDPSSFSIAPIRNGSYSIHEETWHLYWQVLNKHEVCVCSAIEQESITLCPLTLADLLDFSTNIIDN